MHRRSTLPHPSIFDISHFNAQSPESPAVINDEEMIALYKRSNSTRREELLCIMTEAQMTQLRQDYLNQLDAAIAQFEAQQHPASLPARAMADEIRAQRIAAYRTFDILHRTVDLAVTPSTDQAFLQKTTEFRKAMDNIKSDAKTHFLYGLAMAFGAAIALGGIIAMSVLVSPAVAILSWKDIIGPCIGTGIMGTLIGAVACSFFNQRKKEQAVTNKMEAFDKAMHESIPASTQKGI